MGLDLLNGEEGNMNSYEAASDEFLGNEKGVRTASGRAGPMHYTTWIRSHILSSEKLISFLGRRRRNPDDSFSLNAEF